MQNLAFEHTWFEEKNGSRSCSARHAELRASLRHDADDR
jgi:hypothetical protein